MKTKTPTLSAAVLTTLDWLGHPNESHDITFERTAKEFRKATGFTRPGKDDPTADGASLIEREAAWAKWCTAKNMQVRKDLSNALHALWRNK